MTKRRLLSILAVSSVLLPLILSLIPFGTVLADVTSVVDTNCGDFDSTVAFNGGLLQQAEGLYWGFYQDGTDFVYKTSADGSTWSSKTAIVAPCHEQRFSLWFDDTYFHIVYVGATYLTYRRGNPASNGTISWDAADSLDIVGTVPDIALDSNGYPWIAYRDYVSYHIQVVKSSTKDGTWTTEAGFPDQITSEGNSGWSATIDPLLDGKMAVVYDKCVTTTRCRIWNGASWDAEEVAISELVSDQRDFASMSYNGILYVAGYAQTSGTWFNMRDAEGNWNGKELIYYGVGATTIPSLGIDTNTGYVYCFWNKAGVANYVYYSIRTGAGWGTPVTWIDETTDTFHSGSYYIPVLRAVSDHKIATLYVTKTAGATPYQLKFAALSALPVVTTGDADSVTYHSATVHSTLSYLGDYSPVYVSFQYGLTAAYGTNTSEQSTTGTGEFYREIVGLSSSTTYHYRVQVRYDSSYVYGVDDTFVTSSSGSSLSRQVVANYDDCWVRISTGSFFGAGEIYIGDQANTTSYDHRGGMRFTNISIPEGTTIVSAYISLKAQNYAGQIVDSIIRGQDADNAATFSTYSDFIGRNRTTAEVNWTPAAWVNSVWYNSPDLADIIQEIVNREDWESGNSLVIFWEEADGWDVQDYTSAYDYNSGSANAPQLYIGFQLESVPPTVSTGTATGTTISGTTLQGTLTSMGDYSPVYVYFQYGLTTGYGTNTVEQTKTAATGFNQAISGLSAGTLYHFRAVVRYGISSYVYGNDNSFTTTSYNSPTVTTGSAAGVTQTGAVIQGSVTSMGDYSPVYAYFQWGLTTGYEQSPTAEQTKTVTGGFSASLSGLSASTTYYFRAVLRYGSNYVYGAQGTFTTTGAAGEPGIDPPDILRIDDVKVFSGYYEDGDQLYVINYRAVYLAGDPAIDIGDYFDFVLMDGVVTRAKIPVKSWGYRPGSIYLKATSALSWGGEYTVSIIGNPNKWDTPPSDDWILSAGDWQGTDLTQLDTWVIALATSLETYYDIQMVAYDQEPYLTDQAMAVFATGIPGLCQVRPNICSVSMVYTPTETGERDVPTINPDVMVGPEITETVNDVAAFFALDDMKAPGAIGFGIAFFAVGILLTVLLGGWGAMSGAAGMAFASPVVILGAQLGYVPWAIIIIIAAIAVLYSLIIAFVKGS